MKKRLLAFLCLVALAVGGTVIGLTANASTDYYLVGYAIRDINPWVDPADHTKGMLPIKLTGNGNDNERVCTGLMDDNDDGRIGEGDGLFTTATAVTDPYGKTVFYITIDALQGYENITADVRTKIVAELGGNVISAREIMVSANHSHSAPTMSRSGTDINYYNYIVDQITDAAKAAYADRSEAVMSKGSVDAKDSTAYLGYNNGAGYNMNSVRHYDVTSQHKKYTAVRAQHVAGSGFGNTGYVMADYKVISKKAVKEADNTMYVLKFDFPNDQKESVVFVNWRAHSTTNSGGDNMTFVSSDYANSIRANLKKAGYRAAFFQGASGNVVVQNAEYPAKPDWTAECNQEADANVYGRLLSRVVVDCITREMTQLPVGRILNLQKIYHGQKQQDSPGLVAAAKAFQAESDAKTPYKYTYTDGKTYTINSRFHANLVVQRSQSNYQGYTNLELNVILLGNEVAFVTAPGEMSDHYDLAGSTKDADNDWLELVQDATYGTPFVLGYTNDSKGYFPATLDYTYNTQEYYDITKKGLDGQKFFGAGSYEANTSRLARGSGEDLIQMLIDVKDTYRVSECPACKEEVEWQVVYADDINQVTWGGGHYYLVTEANTSNVSMTNGGSIKSGETICIDLNGKNVSCKGRFFATPNSVATEETTLNIIDSQGGAKVTSRATSSSLIGGVFFIQRGYTFNIYGGTFGLTGEATRGGVAFAHGTLNLYDGTILGGKVVSDDTDATGKGGAVNLSNTGNLGVYGGEITDGDCSEGRVGSCVYLDTKNSRVTLSGDARVADIYYNANPANNLTISGVYTGTVNLTFPEGVAKNDLDVGNLTDDADVSGAGIYVTNDDSLVVAAINKNLVLKSPVAVVDSRTYHSVQDALNDCDGAVIKMIGEEKNSVTVSKTAYLDLNGFNITGKVTVAQGETLYCFDTETDDYSVADNRYGKLTNVSGNVAGLPLEAGIKPDAYLMIQENGAYSFHRINLQMTAMTLRAENAGIYYTSEFAADEMVAKKVKQYGVAMSIQQIPTADNLETECARSWFDDFKAGINDQGTGTLLKNVMRQTNADSQNQAYAQMPIYGRAYIELDDGTYVFGGAVSRSFRQQVEEVNAIWTSLSDAQKNSVIALYNTYSDVMASWDIPKIIAAA